MTEPTGQSFEIVTLADIWNLPTADMMSRCLRDLARTMQASRAVDDDVLVVTANLGAVPERFRVAGAFVWTDDGEDRSEVTIFDRKSGKPCAVIKMGDSE